MILYRLCCVPPGPRGATRAAVLERALRGCPGARVSGPETPGNSTPWGPSSGRWRRIGANRVYWRTFWVRTGAHDLRYRFLAKCSPVHPPLSVDGSQTTTSAGCLRQLPGPLRAADAGRGHRPTPTDGARAAQRCKLLVLGLPKRCRPHTMLVSKPLEATSVRSHTISEPVAARHNTWTQRKGPGGPLGALGGALRRLGAEIGALRA